MGFGEAFHFVTLRCSPHGYISGGTHSKAIKIRQGIKSLGRAFSKARRDPRGSAPGRSPQAAKHPFARRRSKRVNSKTVRWIVFEEGKPCKRGFPFEKHGRSFSQAACGLTAGAVFAGRCVHLHPIPPPRIVLCRLIHCCRPPRRGGVLAA